MEGTLGRVLLVAGSGTLGPVARRQAAVLPLRLPGPRAACVGAFAVDLTGDFPIGPLAGLFAPRGGPGQDRPRPFA